MRSKSIALIFTGVLLLPVLMGGIVAGVESSCNPKSGIDFCVVDVDSSKNQVEQGEAAILKVTVRNVGNETSDVSILLGIKQPEGGHTLHKTTDIHDLPPGATKEVDVPVRMLEGGSPGPHKYNIMLFDPPQQHLYDATGYYQTIISTNDSLDILKLIKGLNNFASALIAIAAIVGALVGKRFL
jgi:hypothetical protein